ncbi:Nucleoside-diphosphate-sugar epimerase [Rhodospirillaceae bacterium LM-1]|nr:Nucleoside-diphosphate-sugar epimerase [Rhodospirillaceae bacterium LM-1]
MKLFIFGLGFSGQAVAKAALARGYEVVGTHQEPPQNPTEGVGCISFGPGHPLPKDALDGVICLLSTIPPTESGDPVLDALRNSINIMERFAWVGYLSTTGVYGDRQGGLVDETSPLLPSLERSKRRVQAEAAWLSLWENNGIPVHIFRLAGIYGPGRSAIDSLRAGKAHRVVKPGQVFSRIHVDDIAGAVMTSMAHPTPGEIYNLCDDDPATPDEVIAYGADLLGIDPPAAIPFDQADLSPMARSFYADNKVVSNAKMKEVLGYKPLYPSYREGLKAILKAES